MATDLASVTKIEVVRPGTGRVVIPLKSWPEAKAKGFTKCPEDGALDPDEVIAVQQAAAAAAARKALQEPKAPEPAASDESEG